MLAPVGYIGISVIAVWSEVKLRWREEMGEMLGRNNLYREMEEQIGYTLRIAERGKETN